MAERQSCKETHQPIQWARENLTNKRIQTGLDLKKKKLSHIIVLWFVVKDKCIVWRTKVPGLGIMHTQIWALPIITMSELQFSARESDSK